MTTHLQLPRPGTTWTLVFLLSVMVVMVLEPAHGHEQCLRGKDPRSLDFVPSICTAYNGEARVCMSEKDERKSIAKVVKKLKVPKSSPCYNVLVKTTCAFADAWAAHLFPLGAKKAGSAPILCEAFARQVFSACKDTLVRSNPFLTRKEARKKGTIAKYYDENSFVTKFAASSSGAYCFEGGPYQPPAAPPFTGSDSICFEKLVDFSYPNGVNINVVPVTGYNDLVALGSQNGHVKIYKMGNVGQEPTLMGTLINIAEHVDFGGERGLLGVAFHPGFKTNGRVFLSFSCFGRGLCGRGSRSGDTQVTEFLVAEPGNENTLFTSVESARSIFSLKQPQGNHNGGQIMFSSDPVGDPHLYLMFGDGGGAGDPKGYGQNKKTHLGKILRIDVNTLPPSEQGYVVPADNPFVGVPGWKEEIWALGLRNPWRCSFDKQDSSYFFCGDVGQKLVEEIDLIEKGSNYGWNKYEGDHPFRLKTDLAAGTTYAEPILTYGHGSGPGSITGGYVYRGSRDSDLIGKYMYADYSYGRLYVAQETSPGSRQYTAKQHAFKCSQNSPKDCPSAEDKQRVFSFGEDGRGDVYVSSTQGLFRVVPPSNCA